MRSSQASIRTRGDGASAPRALELGTVAAVELGAAGEAEGGRGGWRCSRTFVVPTRRGKEYTFIISVRRQLDFADADAGAGAGADAGGDLDDYDDFLIRAVDDIERGYNEAKRRAPLCVCRRGDCAVRRHYQSGGWMYVCSSQPKCKYVAMCKEVDQNQSPSAVRNDPKPSNPCASNVPRTPVDDARTRINNVNPQGAGATTPINVSPQAAVATTPFNYTSKGVGATAPVHVSPQGAGATTPINVSPQSAVATTPFYYTLKGFGTTAPVHVSPQGGATTPINVSPQAAVATTPFKYTSKGVGAMTPVRVSPQGAGTTAAVKVIPRWDRSNDGRPPICQCTAGECKILKVGNEDCYVCPIPKGHGACSFKVPVKDAVKGSPQIGDYNIMEAYGNNAVGVRDDNANGSANPAQPNDDEWSSFDVINNEIVLKGQATPRAVVVQQKPPSTPRQPIAMAKTPATSPMTPFGRRSPMTLCRNNACHGCGEEGHYINACPKRSFRNSCFHCGMVGHWQANCPQLRRS